MSDLPAAVAAGIYNVYTGELAAGTTGPHGGAAGPGAPSVLRGMRAPDGGAGAARRLAGEMLAARTGGLGRHGGTAVTHPNPIRQPGPRVLQRSATAQCSRSSLGLSAIGALVGALWAWIAPPIHAVAALTKAGERVHDYLGNESDHFFVAPCLMLGLLTVCGGGGVGAGVAVARAAGPGHGRRALDRSGRPPPRPPWGWGRWWSGCATARWISARYRSRATTRSPTSSRRRRCCSATGRAGGAHPDLAGRHRRAGVCRARGRECPRRSRRLPR